MLCVVGQQSANIVRGLPSAEATAVNNQDSVSPRWQGKRRKAPAPRRNKKRYVSTPLGGQQCVWFPETTERLERLWFAAVHNTVIAAILGDDITPVAVHSKACRMGLPPRVGLPLVKDLEVARKIDAQATPIPALVRGNGGKPVRRRICSLTGTVFWSQYDIVSAQAKETNYYRNQIGAC